MLLKLKNFVEIDVNQDWYLSEKETQKAILIESKNKRISKWIAKSTILNINEIDFKNTGICLEIEKVGNSNIEIIKLKNGREFAKKYFKELENGNYWNPKTKLLIKATEIEEII